MSQAPSLPSRKNIISRGSPYGQVATIQISCPLDLGSRTPPASTQNRPLYWLHCWKIILRQDAAHSSVPSLYFEGSCHATM